jgi:phosphatidate cytidylyltransferase
MRQARLHRGSTGSAGQPARGGFGATTGSTLLRVLTALTLIPIVLAVLWVPVLRPGFVLLVTAFAFVGGREFYTIAKARGRAPEATLGAVGCAAIAASAWCNSIYIVLLVFFTAMLLAALLPILRGHISMDDLFATVFGLVYVGVIGAHFVLLHRQSGLGPGLVTMALTAVALSDTGAYFTGRAIGRHKLAPKVSPGKTVEGALGGIVAAGAGMVAIYALQQAYASALLPEWNVVAYVLVGVLLAVVSQVGDLVESMLKRDAGVKDSGNILPGHGGVLDRCDGILFAAPVMYYLLHMSMPA